MNGILVDTSVWIDFFHGKDCQESIILRGIIENNERLYLCPVMGMSVEVAAQATELSIEKVRFLAAQISH